MATPAADLDQRRVCPAPDAPRPRRDGRPGAATLVLAGALAFCGARLATQYAGLRDGRTRAETAVEAPRRAPEAAPPPAIAPLVVTPPAPSAMPAFPAPRSLPAAPAPGAVPAPRRVVVHYDPRSAAGGADAERIVAGLRDGPGTVETREVAATPRTPDIRFFFPEDAAPARALAAALPRSGEGWRVRDMGGYRPLPRRGTIEVWVP